MLWPTFFCPVLNCCITFARNSVLTALNNQELNSAIMKRFIIVFLSFAISHTPIFAQYQGTVEENLAKTITASELEQHARTLASTEFEGRETGTEGQRKAAAYLAGIFESYGLPKIVEGTYTQKISFLAENWEKINLKLNGMDLKHFQDFYAWPSANTDVEMNAAKEILFLGYGIDDEKYSDYANADVAGKAILIYSGEPFLKDSISAVTGQRGPSTWSTNWRLKVRAAKKRGATAVFIIDPDFKANVMDVRKSVLSTRMLLGWGEEPEKWHVNSYFINSETARKMVGGQLKNIAKARKKMNKKGKPQPPVVIVCDYEISQKKRVRQLTGENVLGFVEGTDPQLKGEVLVVTAHYDHLGKRGDDIYFGADDNASGTSAVLEVAEAFVDAKKQGTGPRRSVLFMLVSGEEKGLLGSQYYAENPVFPLANTIANVNVDMIGRVDEKHKDNPDYIYVIGADRLSSELHTINEAANTTYTKLELDYTFNAEEDPNRYYYRSDHYNFAEKGIPAIFYFSGTHEDYHGTGDTADKLMFGKMEKIARLVFHTSWELANRDKRIVVDKKVEGRE